jgi:23S rRNA (cytosine1962-C5)-methyltransferase
MTPEDVVADAEPLPALPLLRLRRDEERRLGAGHLWVFSNEVDVVATPLVAFRPGEAVEVRSSRDKFIGYATVNPNSLIAARLLSRDPGFRPGKSLFVHRLQVALALRQRYYPTPYYRLVYGEADGLPGCVVDRFGDTCVVQLSTAGMEAMRDDLLAALVKVVKPKAVLWKNDGGARSLEGLPSYVEEALGTVPDELEVLEAGARFVAPVRHGQKTGWFYDQAWNRPLLGPWVQGARVLDVFCYAGAWGVQAARQGAREVICVDSSAAALEIVRRNAALNDVAVTTTQADAFDALEALAAAKERFEVVVVDPPAFAKRRKDVPKAQAAYKRINQLAMQLLARDGLLVSCSCSWHLESGMLLEAIQKAARHLGRSAQVVQTGGQGPDHPVHPAIPETRYLKAYAVRVTYD